MGLGGMFSKIFKKPQDEQEQAPPNMTDTTNTTQEEAGEPGGGVEGRGQGELKSEESTPGVSAPEGDETPSPAEPPREGAPHAGSDTESHAPTKELILEKLSEVYDPEIPIDIVNLGLIYEVEINGPKVHVQMTMTSPGCPTSAQIAQECQFVVEEIPGVEDVWVEIVWDPPWDPSKMSPEARESLGM